MNLQELRIGNFLYLKQIGLEKAFYRVTAENILEFSIHPEKLAEFRAIELTETVFRLCGFSIIHDFPETYARSLVVIGERSGEIQNDKMTFRFQGSRVSTGYRWIQGLHNFQNFYFFLIGEELEFDL